MADEPGNVRSDFEAWAHVAARLRQRSTVEQHAILAELGLVDVWEAIHEQWAGLLNCDIAAAQLERPARYAAICRDEMARRQLHPEVGERYAAEPAGDFREQLAPRADSPLKPASDQQHTLTAAHQVPGLEDFRDHLTPRDAAPPRPKSDQRRTHKTLERPSLSSALLAKQAATEWSVVQYAELCAALESADDQNAEWTARGFVDTESRAYVQTQWGRRFEADPPLRSAWSRLVEELIAGS